MWTTFVREELLEHFLKYTGVNHVLEYRYINSTVDYTSVYQFHFKLMLIHDGAVLAPAWIAGLNTAT